MKSLHVTIWQQTAIFVKSARKTSSIVKKTLNKTAISRLFLAGMQFDKA
jgi:hypothetical protein